MARDIPLTQRQTTVSGPFNEVQFSDAPARITEGLSNVVLKQTKEIEDRAANNAYLRGQAAITTDIARMEQENAADPENLRKALDNYQSKFMENVYDNEVRAKLGLQFQEHGLAAVKRATDKRNQQITEQGQYETFMAMDQLQTETRNVAVDMFSHDPVTKATAGKRLQELMLRGSTILAQTGPDGTPLVSPEKRANFMFALRDGSYESMAKAWLAGSGDKLAAADHWISGKVTVPLPGPDGKTQMVNLREIMPATARDKADSTIMSLMRDHISIENQYNTREDRAYKKLAETAATDLYAKLQDDPNSVTLEQLDMNREIFVKGGQAQIYKAMRENILSGDPVVEDGTIKNKMMVMALSGQDPDEIGLNAVQNKKVKRESFLQARQIYQQSQGPADNPLTFYSARLQESFGGINAIMDRTQGKALSQGKTMLWQEYNKFAKANGRTPTIDEMEPIYQTVLRGVSTVGGQEVNLSGSISIKPSFIPPVEMIGPKMPERFNKLTDMVIKHYTMKYGSDMSKWPSDDLDLMQSREFLKQYQQEMNQESKAKTGTKVQ